MIFCEKSSCNRRFGAEKVDRTGAWQAFVKSSIATVGSAEIELLPPRKTVSAWGEAQKQ